MSFSSQVKEELSKQNTFSNKEIIKSELFGYFVSGNASIKEDCVEFITDNEFNIERIYKLLFNLGIEYEPEIVGKSYKAVIKDRSLIENEFLNFNIEFDKEIVRGCFLGSGYINEPSKSYHLEIIFTSLENAELIQKICEMKQIKLKLMNLQEKFCLYIKEGDEISKFLAFIGANKSVLDFEGIRVVKEIKNNVNRKVNCETANLNKTIEASLSQVNDIKYIMKMNKIEELSSELKELAKVRLEHPEEPLKDLGKYLSVPVGKSGINYRLKKIHEIAEDIRKEAECEN